MSSERPKVVIVGAGFGGLAAAKALARVAVDVIVLDRQNHHCFQPLLYQVATAALSPAEIAWPIRHMLRTQRNATVLMAEVTGVDLAGRLVQTAAGPISYDYLVIATGATHSYFGHAASAQLAPGLKRIEDATRIRRRILLAFEQAELADTERSEEHTSELQSPDHLVCRLLLEKKKNSKNLQSRDKPSYLHLVGRKKAGSTGNRRYQIRLAVD